MSLLPLTRTCRLADFPGCTTAAVWQQRFVDEAYQRWWPAPEADLHAWHGFINASGCAFAPLPEVATMLRTLQLPEFLHGVANEQFISLVALMVVDRIESPVGFLKQAARQLQPGGLLLLTFAYWDAEGPDTALGHELRRRIYHRDSWRKLATEAEQLGFSLFGGRDWSYAGHTLVDHSLATLALVKEGARP